MNARRQSIVCEMVAAIVCALGSGCQQKMADQPSFKPLDPAVYGHSAASARVPVAGTVARGHLHTDWPLFTGRSVASPTASIMGADETTSDSATPGATANPAAPGGATDDKQPLGPAFPSPAGDTPATGVSQAANSQAANSQASAAAVIAAELDSYRDVVDEFPMPITEQIVEHGRDRYMIYCVVCHDAAGTGHGKIVERGYTRPPSYHIDRLRTAPLGHFFRVISLGYGSMPAYASQIPPRDRWAIIAYVRALQLSQHFPQDQEDQLPKDLRDRLSAGKAPTAPGGTSP